MIHVSEQGLLPQGIMFALCTALEKEPGFFAQIPTPQELWKESNP